MMEHIIQNIHSGEDSNISILFYIKNNISVNTEIYKIKSGIDTDIRIHEYFQNSPDYQKLLRQVESQRLKISKIVKKEDSILIENEKLRLWEYYEKEFRTNALRLAETFLRIEPRTERLQKARALFEQGLILDADKILVEMDLMKDQDALIAQMDYLQARKIQLLDLPKM